jgi:hypothetical protein
MSDIYLSRLEWEGLQEKCLIDTIVEPDFLLPCVEKIEIWRNEDYLIKAQMISKYDTAIENPLPHGKAGERANPIVVKGNSLHGSETYEMDKCYIGNINSNLQLNSSGEYINQCSAELLTFRIKRTNNTDSKRWSLTEWYLNSPNRNSICSRVTDRKHESYYFRHRHMDPVGGVKYPGGISEGGGVDYAYIAIDGLSFILQHVPDAFSPNWCNKLGIEYRDDFGRIPEENERKAISEIISFILGRQLLNVGFTVHDSVGYPIEEYMINPWGDAKAISRDAEYQPIKLKPFDVNDSIEKYLLKLIPNYIQLRDQLNLSEALWRYWISNQLPVGTDLPILASGLEILAAAWFDNSKSPSKGTYMEKKEWDALIKDELESIRRKLDKHPRIDRIINKINGSFQMGFNEKFDVFFEEIGLAIGEREREALRSRNRMIHATYGTSDAEIEHVMKMSRTYRTLFHRVLLKLLHFEGSYIDYSTNGWPEIQLADPPG